MTFDNNVPTKFPKISPRGPSGELLLASERAKASFDVDRLTRFMYTEEWLDKMDKVLKVMESEPAFDKSRRYFMGREEKIKVALLKDKRFLEIVK